MFTEAIAPIGNATERIRSASLAMENSYNKTLESLYKEQDKSDKNEEKNQMKLYNAEARRLNAQAKLDSIAYANRLADMSQQQGRHIANVAGELQSMAGGINAPVQISPQGVEIRTAKSFQDL